MLGEAEAEVSAGFEGFGAGLCWFSTFVCLLSRREARTGVEVWAPSSEFLSLHQENLEMQVLLQALSCLGLSSVRRKCETRAASLLLCAPAKPSLS